MADSGHANGTLERSEAMRYKSIGVYWRPTQRCYGKAGTVQRSSATTKRVCRSTLAAEASHLAEAVEAGDWITVLPEEALTGN